MSLHLLVEFLINVPVTEGVIETLDKFNLALGDYHETLDFSS